MRRTLIHLLALALVLAALPALAEVTYLSVMVHNGSGQEVLGQVKGSQQTHDLGVRPDGLVFLADQNPVQRGQEARYLYSLAFVTSDRFTALCQAEVQVVNRGTGRPVVQSCRVRTKSPACQLSTQGEGTDLCAVTIWLAPPPAKAALPRR
jgi:hypothetical protein